MFVKSTVFFVSLPALVLVCVFSVVVWRFRNKFTAWINSYFTTFPMKGSLNLLKDNIARKNSTGTDVSVNIPIDEEILSNISVSVTTEEDLQSPTPKKLESFYAVTV